MGLRLALRSVGLGLVAGLIVSNALAYVTWQCDGKTIKWNHNPVRVWADPASFPSGGAFRTALEVAVNRWNSGPSKFGFRLHDDTGGTSIGNDVTEILFAVDDDPDAAAITFVRWKCGRTIWNARYANIVEADIVFDVTEPWGAGEAKGDSLSYGGPSHPFRNTAIHELGHALGLAHEGYEYNIMGTSWNHVSIGLDPVAGLPGQGGEAHKMMVVARAYAGEDASDGSVFLYEPASPAREDVGVVHWRWTGTNSGGYSTHARTRIFEASRIAGGQLGCQILGPELPLTGLREPRYYVMNGQTLCLELTYENNGATEQSVAVGFYLSTNELITSWDNGIGGKTVTVRRNSVSTRRDLVTLPSNLAAGADYYVGAIVDDKDVVDEVSESNNFTYIGIRVQ